MDERSWEERETSVEPASGSSERRSLPRAGAAWEARVSLAQAVPSPTGPSLKEPEPEWAEMGDGKRVRQQPNIRQVAQRIQGPTRKSDQEQMETGPYVGLETRLQHGSKVCPEVKAKYRPRDNWQRTFRISSHETRYLQCTTKAQPEDGFTCSTAHAESEGLGWSLDGVPGMEVGAR